MAHTTSSTTLTNVHKTGQEEGPLIDAVLKTEGLPSLNVAAPLIEDTTASKSQTTDLVEQRKHKQDTDFKPKSETQPALAAKYEIAVPLLRFPLTLKKLRKVSTFIPISINYFQVLHYMDTLMSSNVYFLRLGLPWHPLLSRLYFAIVFFIQTLRAMRYARIGSSATRTFTEQLLKDYPPEKIPIPGPLFPMLQSLCACESDDPLYGIICPQIRNDIGPEEASTLFEEGTQDYILPNIPVITGFLNSIIHADPDNIPDYSDSSTFDTEVDREINGHIFEAHHWTPAERATLLSPGLSNKIESNPDIDEVMRDRGQELDIPRIDPDDNVNGIENFMLMDTNSTWFHNIIDIMSVYSTFFKESTTLGSCSPHGPTAPLVRSRFTNLSSRIAAENIIFHLDHAFPDTIPYRLRYSHRSYEMNIPQNYQLLGEFAAVNTSADFRGLPFWGRFNGENTGREGPYWNQNPSNLHTLEEENILEIENLIANNYFIENPNK
uniref:Uncharacterized protein n=1 Tax=Photinus pyralis TaxID=7054 RepID=A0A1Y1LSF2_PHOPY